MKDGQKFFLSHWELEGSIANLIKKILVSEFNVKEDDVFCSSDENKVINNYEQIHKEVTGANVLLVLISRFSKKRPWIMYEMGCFYETRDQFEDKLVPVIVDGVSDAELPTIFSNQIIRYDISDEDGFLSFMKRLNNETVHNNQEILAGIVRRYEKPLQEKIEYIRRRHLYWFVGEVSPEKKKDKMRNDLMAGRKVTIECRTSQEKDVLMSLCDHFTDVRYDNNTPLGQSMISIKFLLPNKFKKVITR